MSLFEEKVIDGFEVMQDLLPIDRQIELVKACREVCAIVPLWTPLFVVKGRIIPFALRNTNCGKYGWLGDARGFEYRKVDQKGKPWPKIPKPILRVVDDLGLDDYKPENCLINFYQGSKSHLGLHQDKTERNRTAPIISISLGQACIFQMGGLDRDDPVEELTLRSGDVVIMGGGLNGARNAFHGVKSLIAGTTPKALGMKTEARINITIRQVD